jgi:hypothetical protein
MAFFIEIYNSTNDKLVKEINVDSLYSSKELEEFFKLEYDDLCYPNQITKEHQDFFFKTKIDFNFDKYEYFISNLRDD